MKRLKVSQLFANVANQTGARKTDQERIHDGNSNASIDSPARTTNQASRRIAGNDAPTTGRCQRIIPRRVRRRLGLSLSAAIERRTAPHENSTDGTEGVLRRES